jgi:hypothetical protein
MMARAEIPKIANYFTFSLPVRARNIDLRRVIVSDSLRGPRHRSGALVSLVRMAVCKHPVNAAHYER